MGWKNLGGEKNHSQDGSMRKPVLVGSDKPYCFHYCKRNPRTDIITSDATALLIMLYTILLEFILPSIFTDNF